MRRLLYASTVAVAIALAVPAVYTYQGRDQDRVVPNGGITAPGWQGAVDRASAGFNHTVKDSKFVLEGGVFKLNIGPAAVYWNPANTANGDYTIKGTFHEATFQTVNDHPHPYGPFIGGTKLGETGMSLLYCTAFGDGSFIVRGFTNATPPEWGPSRRKTPNPAVNKAEGIGKPVTQEIALSVKGDAVSCTINGTEVWKATKADVVGAGKLESTDGIFGIRVSHNVDVEVKGFGKS
jgi:hypothetical protein